MPTNVKQKFIDFFEGYWFPVYIAFNVITGHIFNMINYGVVMITLATCIAFILCKDLKFFLSPLLCFYFIFSKKSLADETLYSIPSIIFFSLCITALVLCIVAHFVINKKDIKLKRFTSSSLFFGFIAIVAVFLLNGFFAFADYKKENIIFGILIAISFVLPFFIFSINLRIDKKTVNYLIYVFLITSIIIIVEFIYMYLTDLYVHSNGHIFKDSIDLGWGVSNNIGAILAMLMPFHFYCAVKARYSIPFFVSGVMCYAIIILTMSRTSIIIATLILALCLGFVCIYKHKNIMINRFSVIAFLVTVILMVFEDKLSNEFYQIMDSHNLFDGSGRSSYYSDGINKFLSNPFLGAGFGNSHGVNDRFVISAPEYYHNTIIQMLGSCGIVGLFAYCFHRFQTVMLFIKNRSSVSFFMGMSILSLLLTSLLDIHLFNIFPAIFYSVILCIFERDTKFKQQQKLKKLEHLNNH